VAHVGGQEVQVGRPAGPRPQRTLRHDGQHQAQALCGCGAEAAQVEAAQAGGRTRCAAAPTSRISSSAVSLVKPASVEGAAMQVGAVSVGGARAPEGSSNCCLRSHPRAAPLWSYSPPSGPRRPGPPLPLPLRPTGTDTRCCGADIASSSLVVRLWRGRRAQQEVRNCCGVGADHGVWLLLARRPLARLPTRGQHTLQLTHLDASAGHESPPSRVQDRQV
jgi:hypothetical protein